MKTTAYTGGAVLGALGVILGAFGAHAMEETLLHHGTTDIWETAARYHMYHALFLIGLGVIGEFGSTGWLRAAAWMAIGGTVIFAGTLYLLAALNLRWLGAVTPVGGLLLISGWLSLLIHIHQRKKIQ